MFGRLARSLGIGALLAVGGALSLDSPAAPAAPSPGVAITPPDAVADESLAVLSQAEGFLRLGRPEAAATLTRRIEASSAHRDALRRVHAWALLESGAFAELGRLLDADSDPDLETRYLRGAARRRLGDDLGAIDDLRLVWWRDPTGAWGPAALRELAELERPYSEAERAAIRRHVPHGDHYSARDGRAAAAFALDRLRRHTPRRSRLAAELQRAVGLEHLRREEWSEAAQALRHSSRGVREPGLARAVSLELGEAERRRGRVTTALALFDRVAADRSDALALDALGRAGAMLTAGHRYRDAGQRFEALLLANPVGEARELALWSLGWIAFRSGDFARARTFFQTLATEAPWGERAPAAIYWGARALEETGDAARGRAELHGLGARFPLDYYAYRAQERLGGQLAAVAPRAEPSIDPQVVHVRGLLAAGMEARARREIETLSGTRLAALGPSDLTDLARCAEALGAPGALARIRERRAVRFPQRDAATEARLAREFPSRLVALVEAEAQRQRVVPHLVAALVRQESRYNVRAVSSAGALGLMQLMPPTARELLREERAHATTGTEEILAPRTNVRVGVRYLGRMLRSFSGQVEMALAAYNAGPGVVTRWRAARGELPMEIFAEEIPYPETATYVRRVLSGVMLRRWLLEQDTPPPGVRAQALASAAR